MARSAVTFGNFFKTFDPFGQNTGLAFHCGFHLSNAARDRATRYADSFVDDEASPLGAPGLWAGLSKAPQG